MLLGVDFPCPAKLLGPQSCFNEKKLYLSGTEKVPPKNFCDKDFAELSGELSGAICLKTLVLMGNGQ